MTDVISRSDLLRNLGKRIHAERKRLLKDAFLDFSSAIINAPALDVAPVVRCYECKHRCTLVCPMYHTETCLDDLDGFDDYNVDRTDNDGFCHLGARMDAEEI